MTGHEKQIIRVGHINKFKFFVCFCYVPFLYCFHKDISQQLLINQTETINNGSRILEGEATFFEGKVHRQKSLFKAHST